MIEKLVRTAAVIQQASSVALLGAAMSADPTSHDLSFGDLTVSRVPADSSDIGRLYGGAFLLAASALGTSALARSRSTLGPPKEGQRTDSGLILRHRPSIDAPDTIRFAAFTDRRFFDPDLHKAFEPFLPEGFSVVGAPADSNCYSYALDRAGAMSRPEFSAMLEAEGWFAIDPRDAQKGDLVCYYYVDPDEGYQHAARYEGKGMVRSRWGVGAAVVEHPVDSVLAVYKHELLGGAIFLRRPTDGAVPIG